MGDCGPAFNGGICSFEATSEQALSASKSPSSKRLAFPPIIFSSEVVGRKIKILRAKSSIKQWEEAKILEFDPTTGQHKIRFSDRCEDWSCLGSVKFHWVGEVPINAEPNCTYYGSPMRETAVGRKLKVYWPAMNKWYTGIVKSFNPDSQLHRIDYMDGDSVEYNLKHEAVVWLDHDCGSKGKECSSANEDDSDFQLSRSREQKRASLDNALSNGSSIENAPPNISTTSKRQVKRETLVDSACCADEVSTAPQVQGKAALRETSQCTCVPLVAAPICQEQQVESVVLARPQPISAGKLLTRKVVSRKVLAARTVGPVEGLATPPTAVSAPESQTPRRIESLGQQEHTQANSSKTRKRTAVEHSNNASSGKRAKRASARVLGAVPQSAADGRSSALGSRVGIYWEGDETYYRAKLVGHDAKTGKYEVRYDDGVLDWLQLENESFRWYTPRGKSAGYRISLHQLFLQLGAGNISAAVSNNVPSEHPKHESEPPSKPEEALHRRVAIYWPADGVWYPAEILAYNSSTALHHVLYLDGEDEWLDLLQEHVTWYRPARHTYTSAGLCSDDNIPSGRNAIGWRIAVYWKEDMMFYDARIIGYDNATGRHQILYNDNQIETISLHGEKLVWRLPATVGEPVEGVKDQLEENEFPTREVRRGRKRLHAEGSLSKNDSTGEQKGEQKGEETAKGRPRKLKGQKSVPKDELATHWASLNAICSRAVEELKCSLPETVGHSIIGFQEQSVVQEEPGSADIVVIEAPPRTLCPKIPCAGSTADLLAADRPESVGAAASTPVSPYSSRYDLDAGPSVSPAVAALRSCHSSSGHLDEDVNAGGAVELRATGAQSDAVDHAKTPGLDLARKPCQTDQVPIGIPEGMEVSAGLHMPGLGLYPPSSGAVTKHEQIQGGSGPPDLHVRFVAASVSCNSLPKAGSKNSAVELLQRRLLVLDLISARVARAEAELGLRTPVESMNQSGGAFPSGQRLMIAPTTARKSIRVTMGMRDPSPTIAADEQVAASLVQGPAMDNRYHLPFVQGQTFTAARRVVKHPTLGRTAHCLDSVDPGSISGPSFGDGAVYSDCGACAVQVSAETPSRQKDGLQRFSELEVYDRMGTASCINHLAEVLPGDDLTPAELDDLLMDIDPKDESVLHGFVLE